MIVPFEMKKPAQGGLESIFRWAKKKPAQGGLRTATTTSKTISYKAKNPHRAGLFYLFRASSPDNQKGGFVSIRRDVSPLAFFKGFVYTVAMIVMRGL